MRLASVMLALSAIAAAGCRDEATGETSTTSHVLVAEPTPLDQGNDPRDLERVGAVRRHLVSDAALSLRAKNAIVVVRDGVVTLRGDVLTRSDHDALVARVVSVPGVVRIDDRIHVMKE